MAARKQRTPNGWRVEGAVRRLKKTDRPKISDERLRELLTSPCRYCGTLPRDPRPGRLDRLDPALGLTEDNTAPICDLCRRAKLLLPEQEFLAWITKVYEKSVAGPKHP